MFEIFDQVVPSELFLEQIGHYLGFSKEIPIGFSFILAIVMTVWRYVVQFGVSGLFKLMEPNIGTEADKQIVRVKAGESGFKLFYYAFSWFWLVSVVEKLDIWGNTINCIVNYPYPMSYSISAVYMWELGFYISGLVCHFTIETRRKDFVEMAVHHFVTVLLIGFSYSYHYERIGLLILCLHDVSDIFLEMGKLFSYLDWDFAATTCFLGLLVSWFVARLYYFPTMVLTSVWYEHYVQMQAPLAIPLFILLCILQVLHVYWFSLMVNLAYKKIFVPGAKTEDIRETEEDNKLTSNDTKKEK